MRRYGWKRLFVVSLAMAACLGAAPAAPSYHMVEQSIGKIRGEWSRPGASAQPNAPGWNALFDALLGDLRTYSSAASERDRLAALNRVYQISNALASVAWPPAAELREGVREWLRPRVRLAWAERHLVERVNTLPTAADPTVAGNRQRWVKFVDDDLGSALRRYDGATTVAQRQEALREVYAALDALQNRNQTAAWSPSAELLSALRDLYNQPNFDISVDVNTLSPALNQASMVPAGPVQRKGYISQVTPGPKTGFGLLPSDDGIAFYNSQLLTTVTPIWDFQKQVQSDQKGKRAAKLYQFNATTNDTAELIVTAVIRSSGISLYPTYRHNVGADISTTPQQGKGFARAIAGMIGYNQPKITQLAWENAIGQIRANIVKEAQEESLERTGQEAATRNAALAQYLIGGDRVAFRNILIENLSLRSRPENALIGGKLEYLNARNQIGADAPQPPAFARPESGVTADLHLSSIMANFTRGYLQSPAVEKVENLMVVTEKIPPDAPPSQGVKVTQNTDYPTFLKAVETAQAAHDPKVLAVRVKRPGEAPEFGVDSRGYLVALVHDFQLDVPAPPEAARGGLGGPPARVFRIASPNAEVVISFKVEPKSEKQPIRLTGRIEDFDPGPQAKVYAINEDESQAKPLTIFASRVVLSVFAGKLRGQPIDVPLSNLELRGFAIRSVSPLDPSGWIRVTLDRTSPSPAAGIQ